MPRWTPNKFRSPSLRLPSLEFPQLFSNDSFSLPGLFWCLFLFDLTHRWEGEAQPAYLVMSELCAAKELPLPPRAEPHLTSFISIRSQMQPQITSSVPLLDIPTAILPTAQGRTAQHPPRDLQTDSRGADSTAPSEGPPNGLKDLRTQEPCFLSISWLSTGQTENEFLQGTPNVRRLLDTAAALYGTL